MSAGLLDEHARIPEEAWRAKAVVASDGNGNGCVVWYVGESMRNEIEECGFRGLDELGLDDAPAGISVWEGTYVWIRGGYECPEDGEMVVGSNSAFRAPTDEEWTAIREKRNPWEAPIGQDADEVRT